MLKGLASTEDFIVDHCEEMPLEDTVSDIFQVELLCDLSEDLPEWNSDLPHMEPDYSCSFQNRPDKVSDQFSLSSCSGLEVDPGVICIQPDEAGCRRMPRARASTAKSPKSRAFFTSAFVHAAAILLLAVVPASQVSGAAGQGNVIALHISQEDMIPQDESPASVDSAASMPSIAGKRKEVEKKPDEPLEQPMQVTDQPEFKVEKEIINKKEESETGHGPMNSVASAPSTASAERKFIAAAGQDGKAFESLILSAIREAIFFPKKALNDRHYGEVVVAFAIGKDGSILALHIMKASGSPHLDEAALKIVQKAAKKFPPIPDNLDKQSVDYVVPIHFREKRG